MATKGKITSPPPYELNGGQSSATVEVPPPYYPDQLQQGEFPQQQQYPQQPQGDYLPTVFRQPASNRNDDARCILIEEPPPPDYWAMSCLVKWLCCWPLGCIAMHFSWESQNAASVGNYDEALELGKKARNWNIAGIVIGTVVVIIVVLSVICSTNNF